MTKSELRSIIREMLVEELVTGNYLLTESVNVDRLIAKHVCDHPEFESACMTGDATKIMSIIDSEMKKNDLYTPGAQKFRDDVMRMTRGRGKVPAKIGEQILFFAWNAQASALGFKAVGKSLNK